MSILLYETYVIYFVPARAWDPEDSDVHEVLGVLYNVSSDYESAVSEIETGLSMLLFEDISSLIIQAIVVAVYDDEDVASTAIFWISVAGTVLHIMRQAWELHVDWATMGSW